MRRVGLAVTVVLAAAIAAEGAVAQDPGAAPSLDPVGFELEVNYPNPFSSETTIPYSLGEGLFVEDIPVVVTVRILDVLSQVVAHGVAVDHPAGPVAVRALEYTSPGLHEAFWDGADANGVRAAPGIYLVELTVNDQHVLRRMFRSSDPTGTGDGR